jgi:anti-sigma factor RsiW
MSFANLRPADYVIDEPVARESSMMMTCLETESALPQFIAGRLSKPEREELLQHIAICSGCRERFVSVRHAMQTISQSVATLSDPSANEIPPALLRAIAACVGTGSTGHSDWRQF